MTVIVTEFHSSFTAYNYFDNGFVRKQPVSWKECCARKAGMDPLAVAATEVMSQVALTLSQTKFYTLQN